MNTADIVIGSRFKGKKSKVPRYRNVGIKTITSSSNVMTSLNLTDAQSGMRAYNVKYLRKLLPSELGMSASTEILSHASSQGLRIDELPIEISYLEGSSSKNSLSHGLDVFVGTFKQYSLKHPLLSYGVSGVICLSTSLIFWVLLFARLTQTGLIETNWAILAIGLTLMGFMLVTTGMILWTIISAMRSKWLVD